MKGFLKLLFSRVGMVSLGILLQLIVLVASLLWFRDYAPVINVVSAVLSWGFVLYLIAGKSNPDYKLAWIILILGFPVLGVSLYLIFGGNRLSKRLRRKMEDIDRTLAESLQQEETVLEALRQRAGICPTRSTVPCGRTRKPNISIPVRLPLPGCWRTWPGPGGPFIWNILSWRRGRFGTGF